MRSTIITRSMTRKRRDPRRHDDVVGDEEDRIMRFLPIKTPDLLTKGPPVSIFDALAIEPNWPSPSIEGFRGIL
jgi:hypothetical protein